MSPEDCILSPSYQRPLNLSAYLITFLLVLLGAIASFQVQAQTPAPNLPLPPCVKTDDGKQTGACSPQNNDEAGYSLEVEGRLSEKGSSVYLTAKSAIPPCDQMGRTEGIGDSTLWTPSPCYSSVGFGSGLVTQNAQCAYIDLRDNEFKYGSCIRILYKDSGSHFYNMADLKGQSMSGRCSSGGEQFGGDDPLLYVPLTERGGQGPPWSAFGPVVLAGCTVTFLDSRPDGLYGPTWAIATFSVNERTTPFRNITGSPGASVYVPIDGDMRDFGVLAAFDANVVGRKATFTNHSVASSALTYRWDFGDAQSSTEKNPTHIYDEGGTYTVNLTARDDDGTENIKTELIEAVDALIVEVTAPVPAPKVGEEADIRVDLHNYETSDIGELALEFGVDSLLLDVVRGPNPSLPSALLKDASTSLAYTVKAKRSGVAQVNAVATGTLTDGKPVSAEASEMVRIPAQIALALSSSVKAETKVGDEVQIFLTLTNNEDVTVDGITVEPLGILPNEMLSTISGPTAPDGSDPRVNRISLAAGKSIIITFTYRAEQKGTADLSAYVAGNDPYDNGRFITGAKDTLAIESAAIRFSNLRLQPGSPIPGSFGLLRGTVTNKGSIDVINTDVALLDVDQFEILPEMLAKLSDSISPRIAKLAVDESQDFMVPVGVRQLFGPQNSERPPYTLGLRMQGTAVVDGKDVEVVTEESVRGTLDLTKYWFSILDEVKADLVSGFQNLLVKFSDYVDAVGNTSLGGTKVGQAEGVLNALQEMGDGLLTAGNIGINTVSGEYKLTEKGKALVQTIIEYGTTRSGKEMMVDLADLEERGALALGDAPNAVLDVVGHYFQDVAKAYNAGNDREVARLLTKPAATLVLSAGGEIAVSEALAPVMANIITKIPAPVRKAFNGLKKAPEEKALLNLLDPDQVAPVLTKAEYEALSAKLYKDVGANIKDIPVGVPLTRETIARTGIDGDELSDMISLAKQENTAFFVRPRPAEAARWAELGYNGKPLPIKLKSNTNLDVKWLGTPDKEGLLYIRDPVDPYPALKKAVESGELKIPDDLSQIIEIEDLYNTRKANFDNRQAFLDKANSVKTVKDEAGNVIETYKGIKYKYLGEDRITELYLDADGLLKYTVNDFPVYSDIDIYFIGRVNGDDIPLDLYQKVVGELDVTAGQQHRTTANSADLPNKKVGVDLIQEYGGAHMRGGEPLVVIGPDSTFLAYVDTVTLKDTIAEGSGLELYNKLATVTYVGTPP